MDMKNDIDEEIKRAIAYFTKLYGKPPSLVEYCKELKLKPVESQIEFKGIRIPQNILLLGE